MANKVFIIESLPLYEKQTGTELYQEIKTYENFQSILYTISDKSDLIDKLNRIKNGISVQDVVYIHFEIHGDKDGSGFSLKNEEKCAYQDLTNIFVDINKKTGCNLYITMAVCCGLNTLLANMSVHAMPFAGIIASEELLYVDDLQIRFSEFYKSLSTYDNISVAFNELKNANSSVKTIYRYIEPYCIFYNVWRKFISYSKNPCFQKQNLENNVLPNYVLTEEGEKKFNELFQSKDVQNESFKELAKSFFLLDIYPENENRFFVPNSIENIPKCNYD